MAPSKLYKLEQWLKRSELPTYRAKAMAESLGISLRQLERWTQEVFKRSPHDLLDEQRFLMAADKLKTHQSVKVVAADLQFKQVSHFSREFKRYYKLSPTAFLAWLHRKV
jgi:AraC-like DNA-binding protein